MAILQRVAPWLAFLLGELVLGPRWAAPFATVATAVIVVVALVRGARSAELILDGSGLAYFAGFSVGSLLAPGAGFLAYVAAGAQLFHAAVIAVFLALDLPFTLAIARRGVPAEVADSAPFRRFNVVLSLVWLTAFFAGGVAVVALLWLGIRATWLQIAIVVVSIVVPSVVQRRMVAAARARAAAPATGP